MGSFFNDLSLIHDVDAVTVHDRGKTMGNDDTGRALVAY